MPYTQTEIPTLTQRQINQVTEDHNLLHDCDGLFLNQINNRQRQALVRLTTLGLAGVLMLDSAENNSDGKVQINDVLDFRAE